MENLSVAQILERMDARSVELEKVQAGLYTQLAQIIANQTTALHNIARYADIMAQSLAAIQQRQLYDMEERTIALRTATQSLEISARILAEIKGR